MTKVAISFCSVSGIWMLCIVVAACDMKICQSDSVMPMPLCVVIMSLPA